MEFVKDDVSVSKIYTFRYIFKMKDSESLGVKYVTDTLIALETFEREILSSVDIVSCVKEYVGEVDISQTGFVTTVKAQLENEENKVVVKDEKI